LVNNAATHPPPIFDLNKPDWELWKKMIDVNIMGVIACSRAVAPFLKETNGCIVNVVMDWDAGGIARAPIRVNAVSPGAINTWNMTDEEKEYWVERTLLKRVGKPLDIAYPILFLASEEAGYITGATLQVDGGMRLLV
jgi:NAD(P)-dependent dehydrogenase (short-subunit alcohol dehydrogenase family)